MDICFRNAFDALRKMEKRRVCACACVSCGRCQSSTLSLPVTLVPAGYSSFALHDETVAKIPLEGQRL